MLFSSGYDSDLSTNASENLVSVYSEYFQYLVSET